MEGDKELRITSPTFALIGDERDAARYRWMRKSYDHAAKVLFEFESWQHEYRTPDKFDEEVDRAMREYGSPPEAP